MDDDDDGMEDVEVPWVDGVLEGALGALGDGHWGCGDGVVLSSLVRSMKSCFGGMITSFCFLALLEMVVLGDDMVDWFSLMKVDDDGVWIKHVWGFYSMKTCLEMELIWKYMVSSKFSLVFKGNGSWD